MTESRMQDFQSMREMLDCIGTHPILQEQIIDVIQSNLDCWDDMRLDHRLAALGSTLELFNPLSQSTSVGNAKPYLEGLLQLSQDLHV